MMVGKVSTNVFDYHLYCPCQILCVLHFDIDIYCWKLKFEDQVNLFKI